MPITTRDKVSYLFYLPFQMFILNEFPPCLSGLHEKQAWFFVLFILDQGLFLYPTAFAVGYYRSVPKKKP